MGDFNRQVLETAMRRLGIASLEAAVELEDLGQQFHAELVAGGMPPELLSDPEFQRRVRAAVADDPTLSLGGHMIDVAAVMESERSAEDTPEARAEKTKE